MDHMGSPPFHPADHSMNSAKRKRSLSNEPPSQPTPPTKAPKTNSHLHINYLARQYPEILPLISAEHDSLPSLLSLIGDYEGVLHRHESMAGNLGARPLGPILIQRFERLFDGPPRVLKMNGKESTSVGWLDVVDFARSKPEQFKLEQTREGVKVCQFYTKQCRVEICEDDFQLIKSGMPQKLIPPQPIAEDEEKELGTLEILEKTLSACVHLADQVAGRARQLNHKVKSRRNAILSRREAEATTTDDTTRSFASGRVGDISHSRHTSNGDRTSNSPTGSGFVAVNKHAVSGDRPQYNGSTHDRPRSNGPVTNGSTPLQSASAATRAELLSKFHTTSERSNSISEGDQSHRINAVSKHSVPAAKSSSKAYADSMEYAGVLLNTASPVPIPNTPSSLLPYVKPSVADRFDDSGPYKADMMARMEQLNRGDRVQPPCDRCRRLHMDCLKNLTACMGCTKKHAKCSWKDVEEQELKDHPFILRVKTADELTAGEGGSDGEGSRSGASRNGDGTRKKRNQETTEVRDEELLGEDSGDEDVEMKDRPAAEHSLRIDVSRELPTSNSSPRAAASPIKAYQRNNSLGSNPMDTRPRNSPAPSPSDPLNTSFLAPQARMQTAQAEKANGVHGTDATNGHVQTEYERDIYSQLNEASCSSTEREKTIVTPQTSQEQTVKVYIASSEPSDTGADVLPPEHVDNAQEPSKNSSRSQSQLQQQSEVKHVPPSPKESSPFPHDRNYMPEPQMLSPPASGVPSQAILTPVTPVIEQSLGAQPMET